MELTGDVITEDLGRMLASLCYGDLGPIKRLIEEPEDNEWVRSAALDALVDLYVEGQLERENIIDYLKELFLFKVEQKSSFIWRAMVNTACDLYPEGLVEEIRRACVEGLVNHGDVGAFNIDQIEWNRPAFAGWQFLDGYPGSAYLQHLGRN